MESKIRRTTMKAAHSLQIVKEDPSLHPSWLDDGSWERMKKSIRKQWQQLRKDSPDAQ